MLKDISFNNLRYKAVYDKDKVLMGKVLDAVINKTDLSLEGMVIHGSKMEEFLEARGLKPDIDPFFTLDIIDTITEDSIILNQKATELKNIMAPGEMKENESLFSQIRKLPIYDRRDLEMAVIADIHFDNEGKHSYKLGGAKFLKYLRGMNCTPSLDYCLPPDELAWHQDGYKIKNDIWDTESSLKQNLNNLVRSLLVEAEGDGKLSMDEKELIDAVKVDIAIYNEALESALADNIITDEERTELEQIKETLIQKVITIARSDEHVSKEEKQLIQKLASHMANKRKALFWEVFGGTK
ncbi:MAG: TerB family tellurite resistance protein [Candidatus Heimdallarchaeota archaeon]|nr:TerB family tellurite resistance protein [Candidatus Heimdallarchaeota archaeon]